MCTLELRVRAAWGTWASWCQLFLGCGRWQLCLSGFLLQVTWEGSSGILFQRHFDYLIDFDKPIKSACFDKSMLWQGKERPSSHTAPQLHSKYHYKTNRSAYSELRRLTIRARKGTFKSTQHRNVRTTRAEWNRAVARRFRIYVNQSIEFDRRNPDFFDARAIPPQRATLSGTECIICNIASLRNSYLRLVADKRFRSRGHVSTKKSQGSCGSKTIAVSEIMPNTRRVDTQLNSMMISLFLILLFIGQEDPSLWTTLFSAQIVLLVCPNINVILPLTRRPSNDARNWGGSPRELSPPRSL